MLLLYVPTPLFLLIPLHPSHYVKATITHTAIARHWPVHLHDWLIWVRCWCAVLCFCRQRHCYNENQRFSLLLTMQSSGSYWKLLVLGVSCSAAGMCKWLCFFFQYHLCSDGQICNQKTERVERSVDLHPALPVKLVFFFFSSTVKICTFNNKRWFGVESG